MRSDGAPLGLRAAVAGVIAFLHAPFAVILLYSLTTEEASFRFPPPGLTLDWFRVAWNRQDIWDALGLSLRVAGVSTAVALVMGTLAAAAVHRGRFFGREGISFLLILPIALPGIVTGIALRSAMSLMGVPFSFWTIILGHATFCIVVVYNNVLARYRRMSRSHVEASMDLGASGPADVQVRCPPESRDRARGRRHAGLCIVIRRGHRDHVHRRAAADVADLDVRAADPAEAAPGHQCRGRVCRGRDRHPDPARASPDPRYQRDGRRREVVR